MKNTQFILHTIEGYIRNNCRKPGCILVSAERFGLLCEERKVTNGKVTIDGVPVIIDPYVSFGSTVSLDANL